MLPSDAAAVRRPVNSRHRNKKVRLVKILSSPLVQQAISLKSQLQRLGSALKLGQNKGEQEADLKINIVVDDTQPTAQRKTPDQRKKEARTQKAVLQTIAAEANQIQTKAERKAQRQAHLGQIEADRLTKKRLRHTKYQRKIEAWRQARAGRKAGLMNVEAHRQGTRPTKGPRQTKNQRKKEARRRSLAEVEIKTEAQFDPNRAPSGPFGMNPSFPRTSTPRYWKRTDHCDERLAHLARNNANRYRPPQPSGPPAIPSKYLWNYTPPPPRPPTPALANGRGRKRSVDDDGSYDLKRPRITSPGPGPAPFVSQIPPPVPWAAQDRPAHPPQPHPQTPPSLWGEGPASSSQLQPYTKDKLSGQIMELYEACQQKSADLERKELCRTQLQKEIQKLFPAARIYLAGSSLNGFGSSSSDADLCLVLPRASVTVLWTDTILVLTEINQLFRQLGYLRNVQVIRAKVPILKARDSVSGVEFDLNVNNTVGIRNTFLLRSYAYLEPRVRPLVLVVKKWAQHYDINDASKGTLSSYTLVLMVLHYLQTLQSPVVPSLQKQYPECFNVSMDIHMVPEGPRHIPPYCSSNHASLGDLLLGFLKYYGCSYRWDQDVVSVREGKTLPKNSNYEWKNKFICVEEPFEKKNTARAVHEKAKFDTIKTRFTESWRALQQSKDLNSILPVRLFTSLGR